MNNSIKAICILLVVAFVFVPLALKAYIVFGVIGTPNKDTFPSRPFVTDAELLGTWHTVDYVQRDVDFIPGEKQWSGPFAFERLTFNQDGTTSLSLSWTEGHIWFPGDCAEGTYKIKVINGRSYLFMQWLTGDVLVGHEEPFFYVLERKA